MRLREFAPAGGGADGNYFRELASAWYNGTFDSGSLQKGIKSQQDVERLLNRGIVCPDGKTRKLHIDYNSDFDGVEIYSDDYYEHGDESGELDSRTGQPWGPYDHMEFKDEELDESLNEFAPGGNSASSYYAVTANFVNEFAQQKQEELQDLIDSGWTKQDLAQAGTLQSHASDIAHFEQVRDGFLKGLKPGFDAYLQGDTQLKDQLGSYWQENDLPLNQDWGKIYGKPWGDDGEFNEGVEQGVAEDTDKYAELSKKIQDLAQAGKEGEANKLRYELNRLLMLDRDKKRRQERGVAEGSNNGVDPNNPWGSQGRFVGDTGPAQITATVPRHEFRAGDRVMYKPTGARATIENLYKNGTVARIHVASGMGGQYFDAKVADLRPIGQGSLEEKSTSQAQFRTMAAAAHDPKFAKKVGIKQSVAREFNKADKGQSYKSLPKKAD